MTIEYLALGDSYTVGEGVSPDDSFPLQLAAALRAEGYHVPEPMVIAKTGWTTEELADAIDGAALAPDAFDLVTLLIGVNDQYRGYPIDPYPDRYKRLLEVAISQSRYGARGVLAISVPDYAYTPFGQEKDAAQISRDIERYNVINQSAAIKAQVTYLDTNHIARQGLLRPKLLAADLLHPSALMYKEWVRWMLPTVLKMFPIASHS